MNNKEKDLLSKYKMYAAISNYCEDNKRTSKYPQKNIFENWREKFMKKRIIATACIGGILISGVVFAKDIEKITSNIFGYNASDGVQTAVENGYIKELEPKYIEAEEIKVSVDSFLMDDYNFDMNFRIKLDNKYDIDKLKNLQPFDLKVIDENEKVVFLTSEEERRIATENETAGTPNFHPLFWGGYSMNVDTISEKELLVHLTAYGSEEHKIPKSKKLYVTFSKLTNNVSVDESLNDIYIGNWNFELDVPEEMYNRENIIYKVKSCSDDRTKVENAFLSNTAFKIAISETTTDTVDYELLHQSSSKSASDRMALGKEYVETSDGRRFEPSARSDGDGGFSLPPEPHKIINYSQTFNLTKFDATDTLKVHIFTNKGEEIIIEYERSK